jgi:hypothetical protein
MFETDFGIEEFCRFRDLNPGAEELKSTVEETPKLRWYYCLCCGITRSKASEHHHMGSLAELRPGSARSPMDSPSPWGSLRMFARVVSRDFVVDLMRHNELDMVLVGYQIMFRLVQYSDIQGVMRFTDPSVTSIDMVDEPQPLLRMLEPDAFGAVMSAPYRFSTNSRISDAQRKPIQRKLCQKLWVVVDQGSTRFGTLFAQALYHHGEQLARLTNLEHVTPSIAVKALELMAKLEPAPRMDALSYMDGFAISNAIRLIDPSLAESAVLSEQIQVHLHRCVSYEKKHERGCDASKLKQ